MNECDKRAFTNVHEARRANKGMGNSIRPYYCDDCHLFHVTKDRYKPDRKHTKRIERERRERRNRRYE